MKRKGISPLIAAVLLIAFTMAVASIFAQWAPQLIKDAQGDTSKKAGTIQKCSDITLDVYSADADSAQIQQKTGDEAVGNITVTWYYKEESAPPVQNDTVSIDSTRGSVQVTGGNSSATLKTLEVDPRNCEGAAPVTYTP